MSRDGSGFATTLERAGYTSPPKSRPADHIVQFYQSEGFLSACAGEFLAPALRAGDAAVIVATGPLRRAVESRLREAGLDLNAARKDGAYIALDAAEILSRLMVENVPDPSLFNETLTPVWKRASAGGRAVRIFGEMVVLLVREGNCEAAVALEAMWNEFQDRHPFKLLCGYPADSLQDASDAVFRQVCDCHKHVLPTEKFLALESRDQRLRLVATLQQQAQQAEMAKETLRQAEEMLRAARAAEEAARREREAAQHLREEFLSIASHELRNPLAGLSLHAQLALRRLTRDGHLDPDWGSHALHAITGQATRITRLLDQLLDVSRLEAGAILLHFREVDLPELVTAVVGEARVWSQHHTIDVVAPAAIPVRLDPLRLEQVLTNLLHNAIKYTPTGGSIAVCVSQPDPDQVEIAVKDSGPGIPPEAHEAIFDRFTAANVSGPARGLGLGLYLSRQLVQLHGGDLKLDQPPEGGSRFVVRLPTDAEARHERFDDQ